MGQQGHKNGGGQERCHKIATWGCWATYLRSDQQKELLQSERRAEGRAEVHSADGREGSVRRLAAASAASAASVAERPASVVVVAAAAAAAKR